MTNIMVRDPIDFTTTLGGVSLCPGHNLYFPRAKVMSRTGVRTQARTHACILLRIRFSQCQLLKYYPLHNAIREHMPLY